MDPPPLPPRPLCKTTHVKLFYVHGFLGSFKTFKNLPDTLINLLHERQSCPHIEVDKTVYLYKTKGKYTDAPERLYRTLYKCVLERWSDCYKPLIIFIGHSMGGLVAADTINDIFKYQRPLPNEARVIGLLAYDTPYLSIDRDFIRSSINTLTGTPLSSALNIYNSRRSLDEKIPRKRDRAAVEAVALLNRTASTMRSIVGDIVVRATITAALLVLALAAYVVVELRHSPKKTAADKLQDLSGFTVVEERDGATDDDDETIGDKGVEYLKFAAQNFKDDYGQRMRISRLKENRNIKFKCIYNKVPCPLNYIGKRYRQFIRTDDNDDYSRDLFQALEWPLDPWQDTRPPHYHGGAEISVLAHIHMFGPKMSPTLAKLHNMSADFMEQLIFPFIEPCPCLDTYNMSTTHHVYTTEHPISA
ncbi:hypothetical protein BJV82DRAFT_612321 [Fennellomyces sp. T-0311]|nr:hypothetical protein BJV82DRAFT_612321 [Fennellomyces sp. T-0311]